MLQTATIAQLLRDGIVLTADEAVAIAQKLIHDRHPLSAGPPFGPPTPESVSVDDSGAVWCPTCDATPAVSEIAILLEAMLPPGSRAPGALRYTIARALLNVDAPPFDTVQDFSHALRRFETADREELTRRLFERWRVHAAHQAEVGNVTFAHAGSGIERRHPMPSAIATELRRELRRTDLERYHLRTEATWRERRQASARTTRAIGAGLAAGLALIAAGELMHRRQAIGDAIVPPHRTNAAAAPAAPRPLVETTPDKSLMPESQTRGVPTTGSSTLVAPPRPPAQQQPSPPVHRVTPPAQSDAPSRITGRTTPAQAPAAGITTDAGRRPAETLTVDSNGTAMFVASSRPSQRSVLHSTGEELQVMMIAEDGAKNLHVQPSPDGRSVAFDSDRDGERGIYVSDRDGSHVRRVSGAGYAAMPSWSPDSRQLAYLRRDPVQPHTSNLWLLSVESGAERRLTAYRSGQTWSASWFPDGRRFAYTHENGLLILDAQTGRTQEFKSPISGRALRMPAVSPDGRRVIVQVDQHGAWLLDLKDGSMRCALTDPTAEQFAWMSDGRHFAFHSRRTGEWGVWVMAPS